MTHTYDDIITFWVEPLSGDYGTSSWKKVTNVTKIKNTKELLHRQFGTHNRWPWWLMTLCWLEVGPVAQEESATPAWLVVPRSECLRHMKQTSIIYLDIDLEANSSHLRQCIALFAVAEGWLLLDIGWFVLFF